jgi:hypothetical protein
MSLKHFHIVFIIASWLLAFGCSAWCFLTPDANGNVVYVIGGVASFATGVGLLFYHAWVWKKLCRIHMG